MQLPSHVGGLCITVIDPCDLTFAKRMPILQRLNAHFTRKEKLN